MKTLNALVSLILVLYGNTLFLLGYLFAFSSPSVSAFGWFMVLEAIVCLILAFIVAKIGLVETITR